MLRELCVWTSATHPDAEDVILVSSTLVMLAYHHLSLQALSSLTVCSFDMEEVRRLRWLNDSPCSTKGLLAFFKLHLKELDTEAHELLGRRYRVLCLGSTVDRTDFMTSMATPAGDGLLHTLRDRCCRHADEILRVVHPDFTNTDAADRNNMVQMLGEVAVQGLGEEWVGMMTEVETLTKSMHLEVREFFHKTGGLAELLKYASLLREVMTFMPRCLKTSIAQALLRFNRQEPLEKSFLLNSIRGVRFALESRNPQALEATLLLIYDLVDFAAFNSVGRAAVFTNTRPLHELLKRVMEDAQLEANHPCVLAAVRVLATVHMDHESQQGTMMQLFERYPAFHKPLYHWLARIRPCHLEREGHTIGNEDNREEYTDLQDALDKALTSLADVFLPEYGLHDVLAEGLEESSLQALGKIAKLVLCDSSGEINLKYKALQLVARTLTCSHGRRNDIALILAFDLTLFDAVRDVIKTPWGVGDVRLCSQASDTLKDLITTREALIKMKALAAAEDAQGAPAEQPMDVPQGEQENLPQADGPGTAADDRPLPPEEMQQEQAQAQQAVMASLTPAELMARMESHLVHAYASQRALRYYDPELDRIARRTGTDLVKVTDLQQRLEGLMSENDERSAAAKAAEQDVEALQRELKQLRALLAQAQRNQRAAVQAAPSAPRMEQEGEGGPDSVNATTLSTLSRPPTAPSSMGTSGHGGGQSSDSEAQYKAFKLNKEPLEDEKTTRDVIELMQRRNEAKYGSEEDLLRLVDLLGPAQYASPLHFLQEVLQNFGDCK
jgi:hypothetical protein